MEKLKFKTFNFGATQVLTRAQLKKIMGGVATTTAAKCGTCSAKTTDGYWHSMDCYGSAGDCPCADGLQCSSGA